MHELATACGAWLMHRISASAASGNSASGSSSEAPYSSVSPGVLITRGSTAPPAVS
jgi:hypothetical protein